MSETFCPSRISAIMPCYNAAAFVDEAMNSVMKQTYADVELIVVDMLVRWHSYVFAT